MQTVLEVKNLFKNYQALEAVKNLSFKVGENEIVGLLGPNGAGKTTTIDMILGVLEPTAGSVEINGMELKSHRSEISKIMNFAAVYAHLPANLSVRQNLYIFGLLYGVNKLKEKINFLLREFDLASFADAKTGSLSSGEASRLNLAKSLINEPTLLLLDEPTASLDPSIAELIRLKIKEYATRTGAAILWTSHNMAEITTVCDRVLFVSHGEIILSGDPKRLPAEYGKKDLEELFITVAREPLSLRE